MKELPISRGLVAKVEDEDHGRLSAFKWSVKPYPDGCRYAVCNEKAGGRWRSVSMHAMLMSPPPGHVVVFKNFDGLDCRRDNMLVVSKKQAQYHRRTRKDATSGDKGIMFNEKAGTWSARINLGRGTQSLGTFDTWKEAAEAYDAVARRSLGPLAPMHFPREGEAAIERPTSPVRVPPPRPRKNADPFAAK